MELVRNLSGCWLEEQSGATGGIVIRNGDVYAVVKAEDFARAKQLGDEVPVYLGRSVHAWLERIWYFKGAILGLPTTLEVEYPDDWMDISQRLVRVHVAEASAQFRAAVEEALAIEASYRP